MGCLRLCFLPLGLHFGPLAPILVVLVPTRPTQRNPMGMHFAHVGPKACAACAVRLCGHVRGGLCGMCGSMRRHVQANTSTKITFLGMCGHVQACACSCAGMCVLACAACAGCEVRQDGIRKPPHGKSMPPPIDLPSAGRTRTIWISRARFLTPRDSIWELQGSSLDPWGIIWDAWASVFHLWGSILDLWPLFWWSWCQPEHSRGTPMGYAFRPCGPKGMCSMCGAAVRACAGRAVRHVREQA